MDYPLSYFDGVPIMRTFSTKLLNKALELINEDKKAMFQ